MANFLVCLDDEAWMRATACRLIAAVAAAGIECVRGWARV